MSPGKRLDLQAQLSGLHAVVILPPKSSFSTPNFRVGPNVFQIFCARNAF